MESEERRSAYLIDWRQGLWIQIRQKEDAIWRFISFYAGAIILVAGLVQENGTLGESTINTFGALLIILTLLVVTLWGLLIVLDANYWLARNLLFVGNIEREILLPTDMNVLLPERYTKPSRFRYTRSYILHIHIFFFTIFLLLLGFTAISTNNVENFASLDILVSGLISITFCIGLAYLLDKDQEWIDDFEAVRREAPGKNATRNLYPWTFDSSLVFWSSPILNWGWIMAFLGCGIFLFLLLNIQQWIIIHSSVRFVILIIFWLIAAIGIMVKFIINTKLVKKCVKSLAQMEDLVDMEQSPCAKRLMKIKIIMYRLCKYSLLVTALLWIITSLSEIIRYFSGIV